MLAACGGSAGQMDAGADEGSMPQDAAPICPAGSDGVVCRAAAGPCDVAEVCAAGVCPPNVLVPVSAAQVCRAQAGDCDVEEICDGVSPQCPADSKAGNATTCRAAAGLCDQAETCDGVSDTCPADSKKPNTTECRPAAGPCDVAELCDGTTDGCGADVLVTAGQASTCAPYFCDGAATSCPSACTLTTQCATGYACSGGTCKVAKRVFVTSTSSDAALGGLAGADGICATRASAASLSGTFLAWLSTAAGSPSTRFTQHTGPYVQVDRSIVADSYADLTDTSIDRGITITETGVVLGVQSAYVWSSTLSNGTAQSVIAGSTCTGYTSASSMQTASVGSVGLTDSNWSGTGGAIGCNNTARLLCFEQ